ncbi:uncharacterized protein BX664DRAFT_299658 [Halteromyces radiatus]|uniref:uncharacterized protein n=1 Tax=Halteromyces radiatus TaxID=101107 RepID=UPI002220B2A9|nr:uncharacterized protein BX664DRAFT_299658 [Halteromyces radiatus]KAI8086773.1 hypothetical protein BX664DRAFT_299658 [Halteromyces radiatus]
MFNESQKKKKVDNPWKPETKMGEEYRLRSQETDLNQWYFDEYSGLYRQILQRNIKDRPKERPPSSSDQQSSSTRSQQKQPSKASSTAPIYGWCKLARQSNDPSGQLKLCKSMAITLSLSSSLSSLTPEKEHVRKTMMIECLRLLKRLSAGQGLGKGGDSEAQFILANCYGMGLLGLTEDHAKAFQWYVQASKQAHPEATYRTAVCHELGIGTRKDGQRAMAFYRKAAHLAHVGSMYKLGIILLRGYYHMTPLPREAISWLQRAATPHALHALAMIQLTGEVGDATSLIADPAYAMELLHQAAQGGYVPSQVQLGHCYEHGQWVTMDDALSIYWYARAAEQGNPEGCLALSGWYLTGSTTQGILRASDREAYLWARRAASSSMQATEPWTIAKAYFAVAMYTERGIGTTVDKEKARQWMSKAAALGHVGARHCLSTMKKKKTIKEDDQESIEHIDQKEKIIHIPNKKEEISSKCIIM